MKLTKPLLPIGTIVLCALTAAARAESTNKPLSQVQAIADSVTDNRTSGDNAAQCRIELKFVGDAAANALGVKWVRLAEAVDDLGGDLKMPDSADEPNSLYYTFRAASSSRPLKVHAEVRNPSRHATFIKVLKGEVGFFFPAESNGGTLRISNVLQNPTMPIQNQTLSEHKIELVYWPKEVYAAKRKEIQQAKTDGSAGVEFPGRSWEMFGEFYGKMISGATNLILMLVKDPDKRVVRLEFQDSQGNKLRISEGRTLTGGDFQFFSLQATPPPDTQLLIYLATPEAIKSYPFEIQNIPLP